MLGHVCDQFNVYIPDAFFVSEKPHLFGTGVLSKAKKKKKKYRIFTSVEEHVHTAISPG